MQPRPDLLDAQSPAGLEVFQLTTETAVPASHIYMEAQIFAPDSKRFVLHRAATPHWPVPDDPAHRYLLCDLDNGGALSPLTDECRVTGPAISPDGQWFYYFHDETALNAGRLSLKRVRLDGTGRETILTLDQPAIHAPRRISRLYPLATISSDGQRIAISGFLGDGRQAPPLWGLLVFDIGKATAEMILAGPSWCNIHPQYCRSRAPAAAHDILVQENHGNLCSPAGVMTRLGSWPGADIHVIRDDGAHFREMPWGRDGRESCQGHQCWRGQTTTAITSTVWETAAAEEFGLIESRAVAYDGDLGARAAGGVRNVLSRGFPSPRFSHFATDQAGHRFVTDCIPHGHPTSQLYVADLGEELTDPLQNWRYLLDTRSPWTRDAHTHPFLAPDGRSGFFNSAESGCLQAYMVRGF